MVGLVGGEPKFEASGSAVFFSYQSRRSKLYKGNRRIIALSNCIVIALIC